MRPHSSLAYETPVAYAAKFAATGWQATPLRGSACQPVAQPAQPGIQQAKLAKLMDESSVGQVTLTFLP